MTGFVNRFRTNEEILEHINLIKDTDFFNTTTNDLISCLDVELAQLFVKDIIDPKEWYAKPIDPKGLIEGYMEFALMKAADHRGLSALRSIAHMKAFVWLDGKDDLYKFLCEASAYPPYGVPMLKKIVDEYKLPWTEDIQMDRMAQGLPCTPDCAEGCQ